MSFDSLNLIAPLLQAVKSSGYDVPSPIQLKVIPEILAGRDIMAAAQTGTGKTAGFTLPMLQKLANGEKAAPNTARALILAPTRELAAQVAESVNTYAANLPISSFVVFGGVKINPQMIRLRRGVDVLVATPGRLLDLMNQNAIKFPQLEFLVLDEADRMLDMGFLPDIRRVMAKLPEKRQTLLFSATFSEEIKKLCHKFLVDPVSVSVSPQNSTATTVSQLVHPVDKKRKSALLSFLIGDRQWQQVLVFVRTRRGANKLSYDLQKNGIQAEAIHGDKSQGTRTRVLSAFKKGELQALIATDIAARGLDIDQLPHVVNFDLPNVSEDYVHRIGRTGRAGAKGEAISLVSADEVEYLAGIENLIKQKLPRKMIDGFEPDHTLPETHLNTAVKGKKPHKKKLAKMADKRGGQRNASAKQGQRGSDAKKTASGGNKQSTGGQRTASKDGGAQSTAGKTGERNPKASRPRRKPTSKTANYSGH